MEAGFTCFIHKDTHEVVEYITEDDYPDVDPKDWKEEKDKIKKNKKKFIEIERMNSFESFKCMEEFIHSLENIPTKNRLLQAITGRKPFANFKYQIDNSGEYRDSWFAFRREKTIEWIQNQLEFRS